MAFSIKNNNPVSTIVELTSRVVEANEPHAADLHVTLMIQPDEIDIDDYTVEVKVVSAMICVEPHGCETEIETKYGVRKNPAVERRKKTTELGLSVNVSTATVGEAIVAGKFEPIKSSVETSIKANKSKSRTEGVTFKESEVVETEHPTVEAVGADRWVISHADSRPLRGQYVSGERLCRLLQHSPPKNRFGATVTAQVRKRNIDVEISASRKMLNFGSPNKNKIIALMIAKNLAEFSDERGGDTITLAKNEVNDEG